MKRTPNAAPRRPLLALLLAAALCPGLRAMELPLLDEGGVKATLTAEADALSREAPLLATLRLETPAAETPTLPDLRDRLRGFTLVEDFPEGHQEAAGRAQTRWRLRLTPAPEGPWRILPMALTLRDRQTGATRQLATRAADFPPPPPLPAAHGAPEVDLSPLWLPPTWRDLGLWALAAALAAGLAAALLPLLRRLRRALRERALSPEERARLELARLLAEGLPAQGRLKRFYYALTGVVRRYFERAHALRATRQTTEEFLAGLAQAPGVPQASKDALAAFLQAADRVKYAGAEATPAQAEASAQAAGALIEADAAVRAQRG